MNKKAFTLIEVLIVVVILWIWLIWAFTMIGRTYNFLESTRTKLVAINFVRWWVEQVFNIRNSNRQRRGWNRDACWLKLDPLNDEWGDWCGNDKWFWTWSYILENKLTDTWSQKYFALKKTDSTLKTWWSIVETDRKYLLVQDSKWFVQTTTWNLTQRPDNYFSSAMYFQQVRWWYLRDKKNNINLICKDWITNTDCSDGRFLEKNFCVDLVYFSKSKKIITYCAGLTNFKK